MYEALPSRPARLDLLGADFDIYPYLSGYGLLLRVCRLMALEPRELVSSLGLRLRKDLDLLTQVQRPGRVQMALCAAAGVDPAYAKTYWLPESWSPLQTSGSLDLPAPVRQCPECARHGYHTAAFQLPSMDACPWHEQELIGSCPRCQRPLFPLLDGTERLGACLCGFDLFDVDVASAQMRRFPSGHARGWLEAYLRWAKEQRLTRYLVAPDCDYRWRKHYRIQAGLPDTPTSRAPNFEIEEFNTKGHAELNERECWAWCHLGSERPMTYVPLPARVLTMLSKVSIEVVRGLPGSVQTPLELVPLHGLDSKLALRDNVHTRPDCFITPHGPVQGSETWLNLSAIEPEILQLCGRLIDRVIIACGIELDDRARSLQAARAHALEQLAGRDCLLHALEGLIRRAYAQGLDAVLRRHIQSHVRSGVDWWLPSIEVRARPRQLDQIRITWLRVPSPERRRIVDDPLTIATGKKPSARPSMSSYPTAS